MAEQIGANFKSIATNGEEVLLTPAQNVNGAVIRTATMHTGAAFGILSTGPTAPADYRAVNVPVILSVRGTVPTSSGFQGTSATLPFSVTIPAGQGLWVAMAQGENSRAYITYDLLPAA
ncbi:hypothetical protein [Pseudomonas sp. DSP3-2-2]|uniref:hypothetical protein n=1 Tax=unclassified Pseudomonas TaxID=196821 RepID=UPI003CEB3676